MRKAVRLHASVGPEERLATAISDLPPAAQRALVQIADREDLPLVAGSWEEGQGGCLVANVVRALGRDVPGGDGQQRTFDLRVLDLLPELSSRELNHLIVAWDEAAAQEGRAGDPALRRLLRGALVRAGVPPTLAAFDAGPDHDRFGDQITGDEVAGDGGHETTPAPEGVAPASWGRDTMSRPAG